MLAALTGQALQQEEALQTSASVHDSDGQLCRSCCATLNNPQHPAYLKVGLVVVGVTEATGLNTRGRLQCLDLRQCHLRGQDARTPDVEVQLVWPAGQVEFWLALCGIAGRMTRVASWQARLLVPLGVIDLDRNVRRREPWDTSTKPRTCLE